MLSHHGTKANPKKLSAIEKMRSRRNVKEVTTINWKSSGAKLLPIQGRGPMAALFHGVEGGKEFHLDRGVPTSLLSKH